MRRILGGNGLLDLPEMALCNLEVGGEGLERLEYVVVEVSHVFKKNCAGERTRR